MADLWGFENIPVLPRKREFFEVLPEVTRAAGAIPAAIGQQISQRRALEAKLAAEQRKMALEEQKASDDRSYQQGMLAHYRSEDERAARKDAVARAEAEAKQRAAPIAGALKDFGPIAREPEIEGEIARWRGMEEDARAGKPLQIAGGLQGIPQMPPLQEPTISAPKSTSPLAMGSLAKPTLPPPTQMLDVSPAEALRSRDAEMASRVRSMQDRKRTDRLAELRARASSGSLTFEERRELKLLEAQLQAHRDADRAGSQVAADAALLKDRPAGKAIEAGVAAERSRHEERAAAIGKASTGRGPVKVPGKLPTAKPKPPPNFASLPPIEKARWAKANGYSKQEAAALLGLE